MNTLKKYNFLLKNLDCANCANKIQNKLAENKDYKNVNVNFSTLKLTLESELENIKQDIVKIVSELEPGVEVIDMHNHIHANKEDKKKAKNKQEFCKINGWNNFHDIWAIY